MSPNFNKILQFLLILGIGFALAFISTEVRGYDKNQDVQGFKHSLLGTWVLDEDKEHGIVIRWIFIGDVNWETRRMGYLITYYNGEHSSTLEWRTEDSSTILVRPTSPGWDWVHSTDYKITKWELFLSDTTTIFGDELEFRRVCDTDYAMQYCDQ
jgi:hypothetical protein